MSHRELSEYFQTQSEKNQGSESALQVGAEVISVWRQSLLYLIDELVTTGIIASDSQVNIQKAINVWASEKPEAVDHGAWHSYFVYRGMKWLAEQEGQILSDPLMQAAAVLHDLIQTLPWIDPTTGQSLTGNQRRWHGIAMAKLIKRLGSQLGFNESDIKDLSLAIRVHDDVFAGTKHINVPFLAQVLSDADKLTGAVLPAGTVTDFLTEQLPESVMLAVQRNAKGGIAYKGVGWYAYNAELTTNQRNRWQYGDRWNLDSLSALKREFFGLSFYTATADRIGQHREMLALESILDQYDRRYDQAEAWIQRYNSQSVAATNQTLQYVALGFTQGDQIREPVPAGVTIAAAIAEAYARVLVVPPAVHKPGFIPRGWKLAIDGEPTLLDPSIARFVVEPSLGGKEGLRTQIKQALADVTTTAA